MSGCATLLPVAPLPPLSMATSAMDPNLGAAAPDGTMQGMQHQVRSRWGWFSCLGHRNATHQITSEGWGLGHRWPPFGQKIQQRTKRWCFHWGGISERACDLGGMCWGAFWHCLGWQMGQQKKERNESGLSLKWLPLAEPMQQPTKNRGTSNEVGFLTRFCLGGTLGEDNYQSFSMAIQAIKNIMKKIHSVVIDGHQMMKRLT